MKQKAILKKAMKLVATIIMIITITIITSARTSASQLSIYSKELIDSEIAFEVVTITSSIDKNISDRALLSTISGTKTTEYKNISGVTLWSVSVTGIFTFNGSTSSCISCSHSTAFYNSEWSLKNAIHSMSGNTASATATATHTVLGIPIDHTKTVTLQCDRNGNLS